jgi:hypothetical protein
VHRVDTSIEIDAAAERVWSLLRPRVLVNSPRREFRWRGALIIPGLFDGEHFFRIEPKPSGGLVFRQGELCPVAEPRGVRRFFVRDPLGKPVNILIHEG